MMIDLHPVRLLHIHKLHSVSTYCIALPYNLALYVCNAKELTQLCAICSIPLYVLQGKAVWGNW